MPRIMPQLAVIWLLFLSLAGPAHTQHTARIPTRGRTVLRNDKPWAHASLRFAATTILGLPSSTPDIVRVRSDEKGRFIADLLPGCSYSGWAFEETSKETLRLSAIFKQQVAGERATIRELGTVARCRLHFVGLADWKNLAPLRFELACDLSVPCSEALDLDADHSCLIPPFPNSGAVLHVKDKQGREIFERKIQINWQHKGDTATHDFVLPRRHPVLLRVLDKRNGLWMPGLEIRQLMQSAKRPMQGFFVGITDDEGYCDAQLFSDDDSLTNNLKINCSIRVSRGNALVAFDNVRLPVGEEHDSAALRKAKMADWIMIANSEVTQGTSVIAAPQTSSKLTGRLLLSADRPLAGRKLFFCWGNGNKTITIGRPSAFVTTNADGRFEVEIPAHASAYRLLAELQSTELEFFGGTLRRPLASVAIVAEDLIGADKQIGSIQLDALRRCDVQVRTAEAAPAPAAMIYLGEDGRGFDAKTGTGIRGRAIWKTYSPLRGVAGRRGRLGFLVPAQNILTVLAKWQHSFALQRPDLQATAPRPLQLVLSRDLQVHGHVTGPNGRRRPGSRVMTSVIKPPSLVSAIASWGPLIMPSGGLANAKGRFTVHLPFPNSIYKLFVLPAKSVTVKTSESTVTPQILSIVTK